MLVKEMVQSACQGNLDAFSALVEIYQDMAVGYAWSVLGDFHLAQDAAQEAFIQAYLNLPRLRDPGAFAGWLRKIVFSCCTRIIRRLRTVASLEGAAEAADSWGDPQAALERRLLGAEVSEAVAALSGELRSVLVLYHVRDYSYRQIAAFLDIPETTVTYRLHQARKKVRKGLMTLVEERVSQVRVSGDNGFRRKIIQGIPKIGWYQGGSDCPEDIPFPAVMRTVLRFLGEDWGVKTISSHGSSWNLDLGMTKFAAIGGCSFRWLWQILESNCTDAEYAEVEPELPYARVLAAAGFDYRMLLKDSFAAGWQGERLLSPDAARELVTRSIDAGKPVIALGLVGPPEPCIITGYDEEGAVVTGWSYFQEERDRNPDLDFEPSGYFRKRDWYACIFGLVLIGERVQKLPPAKICKDTLTWAVELMHTPRVGRFPTGFEGYASWAAALARDEDFPSADRERLAMGMTVLEPAIWDLAERRWYGAMYLEQMAEEFPGLRAQFMEAAGHFQAIHDLMWSINGLLRKTREDTGLERLADPAVRRDIIGIIHKALDRDRQGADILAKLAAAL